tara:strand:- start:1644 stop:1877 length:234 start_codon:yes stop_codon:yes gene_type:complete
VGESIQQTLTSDRMGYYYQQIIYSMSYTDPCTIALSMEKEYAQIHEHWLNDETIEEFLNDSQMNVQCDEFAQENYTV